MATTPKQFDRERLYRGDSMSRMSRQDPIVICGAGAIGSNLVETLARIGVASMSVIDFDRVSVENLSTQVYGHGDVGALKVQALQKRIFRDTGIEITPIDKRLESSNVRKFLKGASLVVDCFDNAESRQLVQDHVRTHRQWCIHVGLSPDGYAEIKYDTHYKVPANMAGDVCDYPMARNLISIAVAIAAEEIVDFLLGEPPRFHDWTFTLKDLAIRRA